MRCFRQGSDVEEIDRLGRINLKPSRLHQDRRQCRRDGAAVCGGREGQGNLQRNPNAIADLHIAAEDSTGDTFGGDLCDLNFANGVFKAAEFRRSPGGEMVPVPDRPKG